MSVGRASGYADHKNISELIPDLWASDARDKLNDATCLTEICLTNPIGAADIKNQGDTIKIPTIPTVPTYPHNKGDRFTIDYLESPAITLSVDYARRFHFGVDEIDLKQFKIKDWLAKYGNQANIDLKTAIETQVFANIYSDCDANNTGATAGRISGNINLGVTGNPITLTKTNAVSKLLQCIQVMQENNVPLDDNWWIVGPPAFSTILKDSDLKNASLTGDEKSMLRNKGYIYDIDRFKVFTSNLLDIDSGTSNYHILFGHKSAIWFVTQFTKVKLFEPDEAFIQAMKGLNVYGFGVLQPAALGQMVANISYT